MSLYRKAVKETFTRLVDQKDAMALCRKLRYLGFVQKYVTLCGFFAPLATFVILSIVDRALPGLIGLFMYGVYAVAGFLFAIWFGDGEYRRVEPGLMEALGNRGTREHYLFIRMVDNPAFQEALRASHHVHLLYKYMAGPV